MPSNAERHQHLDRTQIELTDQHGRLWLCESEVGFDSKRRPRVAPVGAFMPTFKAPADFYPPMQFMRYDPRRPSEVRIDYAGWQNQIVEAHRDIKEQIVFLATQLYKSEAAKYIKEPTEEMRTIIYGNGKGPEPVEPVIAAKQGNGYVLGLREYDATMPGDVRLKPFMDRWKEVRYRDAKLEEGELNDAIDFTEGQDTDEMVPVGTDQEEE